MMDITQARNCVAEQWLPSCEKFTGCAVRISDEDTQEYEWGWVFFVEIAPGAVPKAPVETNYFEAFLIDKVTKTILPANPGHIRLAAEELMEHRRSSKLP